MKQPVSHRHAQERGLGLSGQVYSCRAGYRRPGRNTGDPVPQMHVMSPERSHFVSMQDICIDCLTALKTYWWLDVVRLNAPIHYSLQILSKKQGMSLQPNLWHIVEVLASWGFVRVLRTSEVVVKHCNLCCIP